MATKQENEKKKSIARDLYMHGRTYKEIAEKIDVSEKTIGSWAKAEGWAAKKIGSSITRHELVLMNLEVIGKLLEQLRNGDVQVKDYGKVIDQISKLSASIEKMDKETNVVTVIEIFTSLNKWLRQRMEFDSNITPELLKQFDYYQDLYINEQLKASTK